MYIKYLHNILIPKMIINLTSGFKAKMIYMYKVNLRALVHLCVKCMSLSWFCNVQETVVVRYCLGHFKDVFAKDYLDTEG